VLFFLLEVGAMIGENWQLVTNEPVEFEKSPVSSRLQENYRSV